jgi:hypothetical protein
MAMTAARRRSSMNREHEHDLIDLGAASVETRGLTTGRDDHAGLIPFEGLNDE